MKKSWTKKLLKIFYIVDIQQIKPDPNNFGMTLPLRNPKPSMFKITCQHCRKVNKYGSIEVIEKQITK